MGQKFLFVLVGCIFAAVVGSIFVNDKYISWPIYEEPTIPDIQGINGDFNPPKDYITSESVNLSLPKVEIGN